MPNSEDKRYTIDDLVGDPIQELAVKQTPDRKKWQDALAEFVDVEGFVDQDNQPIETTAIVEGVKALTSKEVKKAVAQLLLADRVLPGQIDENGNLQVNQADIVAFVAGLHQVYSTEFGRSVFDKPKVTTQGPETAGATSDSRLATTADIEKIITKYLNGDTNGANQEINQMMMEAQAAQMGGGESAAAAYTDPRYQAEANRIVGQRMLELFDFNPASPESYQDRIKRVHYFVISIITNPQLSRYAGEFVKKAVDGFFVSTSTTELIKALGKIDHIDGAVAKMFEGSDGEIAKLADMAWTREEFEAMVNTFKFPIKVMEQMDNGEIREKIITPSFESAYDFFMAQHYRPANLFELGEQATLELFDRYSGLIEQKYGLTRSEAEDVFKRFLKEGQKRNLADLDELRLPWKTITNVEGKLEQSFLRQVVLQPVLFSESRQYTLQQDTSQLVVDKKQALLPAFLSDQQARDINLDPDSWHLYPSWGNPFTRDQRHPGRDVYTLPQRANNDHGNDSYYNYLWNQQNINPENVVALDLPDLTTGQLQTQVWQVGNRKGVKSVELGLAPSGGAARQGEGLYDYTYEVIIKSDGTLLTDSAGKYVAAPAVDAQGKPVYQLDEKGNPIVRLDSHGVPIPDPEGQHTKKFDYLLETIIVLPGNKHIRASSIQFDVSSGSPQIVSGREGLDVSKMLFRRKADGSLFITKTGQPIVTGYVDAGITTYQGVRTKTVKGMEYPMIRGDKNTLVETERTRDGKIVLDEKTGLPTVKIEFLKEPQHDSKNRPMYKVLLDEQGKPMTMVPKSTLIKSVLAARFGIIPKAARAALFITEEVYDLDRAAVASIIPKGPHKARQKVAYLINVKAFQPEDDEFISLLSALSPYPARKFSHNLAYRAHKGERMVLRSRNPFDLKDDRDVARLKPVDYPHESAQDEQDRERISGLITPYESLAEAVSQLSEQDKRLIKQKLEAGIWVWPSFDLDNNRPLVNLSEPTVSERERVIPVSARIFSAKEYLENMTRDHLLADKTTAIRFRDENARLVHVVELSNSLWVENERKHGKPPVKDRLKQALLETFGANPDVVNQKNFRLVDRWEIIDRYGENFANQAEQKLKETYERVRGEYAQVETDTRTALLSHARKHQDRMVRRFRTIETSRRNTGEQIAWRLRYQTKQELQADVNVDKTETLRSLGEDVANLPLALRVGKFGRDRLYQRAGGLRGYIDGLAEDKAPLQTQMDYGSKDTAAQNIVVAAMPETTQAKDETDYKLLGVIDNKVRDLADAAYRLITEIRGKGDMPSEITAKYVETNLELLAELVKKLNYVSVETRSRILQQAVYQLLMKIFPYHTSVLYKESDSRGRPIRYAEDSVYFPVSEAGGKRNLLTLDVQNGGFNFGPSAVTRDVLVATGIGEVHVPNDPNLKGYVTTAGGQPVYEIHLMGNEGNQVDRDGYLLTPGRRKVWRQLHWGGRSLPGDRGQNMKTLIESLIPKLLQDANAMRPEEAVGMVNFLQDTGLLEGYPSSTSKAVKKIGRFIRGK